MQVTLLDVNPTDSHHYTCPLRWGDMDAQGHLNNAAFVDYLQEARVDYLLGGPPVMSALLDSGVLVVTHQVSYLRPVVYSPRGLDIELWVSAVGGSRFQLAYDVRDGDEVAVQARTAAVPYDLATNTLRRLTAEERAVLTAVQRPTELLPALPPMPHSCEIEGFRSPLRTRWADLDSYGHVNNVKYFDYLQEARIQLFVEALGWQGAEDEAIFLVRQDVDYRRPLDFRREPYEVRTVITAIGNRSITLAAELRDPLSELVFATGRSVIVAASALDAEHRAALNPYRVDADRAG